MTVQPLPEEYHQEVLPLYRRGDYSAALDRFEALLSEPRKAKDEATLRANALVCLRSTAGTPSIPAWASVADHARRYSRLLHSEEAAGWPVSPANQAFAAAVDLAVWLCPDPPGWVRRYHSSLPPRFAPSLLSTLARRAEMAALDYARIDHGEIAMGLGELYLELAGSHPELVADRVALRTRLAELLAFRATHLAPGTPKRAIDLLNEALAEAPNDDFARRLRDHLVQRGQVVEQIRRFEHDARSRLGGVLAALSRVRLATDLPQRLRRDFLAIERNLVALEAVSRVVMGQQGAGHREIDPGEICQDVLEENELPAACLARVGCVESWSIDVGYARLALDNLVINSLEAYRRRGLEHPPIPVRLDVRYSDFEIVVSDRAGGLSGNLPDPFLPYVSEKGVHQGAGLGLSQARRAMDLQGGSLVPSAEQPARGAAFVMRFGALD